LVSRQDPSEFSHRVKRSWWRRSISNSPGVYGYRFLTPIDSGEKSPRDELRVVVNEIPRHSAFGKQSGCYKLSRKSGEGNVYQYICNARWMDVVI
jgi:hypothetical protein